MIHGQDEWNIKSLQIIFDKRVVFCLTKDQDISLVGQKNFYQHVEFEF